ncbi:MAG: hypothetical protein ACRDJC_15865 [Thermomicrobiales bacterium]
MEAASLARRSALLRLGGALLLTGTVAWLVLSGLHGDLPRTGQEVVEQIQGTLWRTVHMFTIVAIFIVAAGLALISATLIDPKAFALGRAGTMIMVPAAAVLGVDFAIDGFALAALADEYASAPDQAARAMHVMQADLMLKVIGGTSFAYQTLFGLAVAILAGATLLSGEYPRWMCWLGLAGGVVWGIAGILIFTQAPGAGFWLVFIPVLPVALWMLGIGWLARRRGSELANAAGQPSPAPAR